MPELAGKENQLSVVGEVTERPKPTFVTIGNKQVSSSGRWNDDLMADWVMVHARHAYQPIGKLAVAAYSNAMPKNKKLVRARLYRLRNALIVRGHLLVVEYGERGRATAVKLYDPTSLQDKQHVRDDIERLRLRGELTGQRYERAQAILNAA